MEESDTKDLKNDVHAYRINVDEDDYKFLQQLFSEREDAMLEELVKNWLPNSDDEFVKSEFHSVENLNSLIREDRSNDAYDHCCDRFLYEEMLDSFAELGLPNLLIDANDVCNELTPVQRENRDRVSRFNESIIRNLEQCRDLTTEAEAILVEKLRLQRDLEALHQRINPRSRKRMARRMGERRRGANGARTGCFWFSYFRPFGMPYFKTTDRYPSDPNEDAQQIVKENEIMVVRLPPVKQFRPKDALILEAAVLKQLKTERVRQLRATKAESASTLSEEIEHALSVRSIRDTTDWNIPVNFSALSSNDLFNSCSKFTADKCERIWRLVGDPRISKEDFSADEVSRLEQLTRQYGAQDWDRIARTLGTGRSGFVCFVKWIRLGGRARPRRVWTAEESERLHNLCSKLKNVTDRAIVRHTWRQIRREFPHRTYAQLSNRWTYVLNPSLRKGRFTQKECNILRELRREGRSYREIASVVQTRSTVQLRTHYEAVTARRRFNRGPWTDAEEENLLALLREHGTGDWKRISRELGTRSRTQCRLKVLAGTWSAVEKQKFRQLLQKYGENYVKISREMGTKTLGQCRYMRRCTPMPVLGRWWRSETASFRILLDRWKGNFDRISRELGTRSADQCRAKYRRMIRRGEIQGTGDRSIAVKRSLRRFQPEDDSELASRELQSENLDRCRRKKCENKMKKKDNTKRTTGWWSDSETELFRKLVGRWKCNFDAISRELGTRSVDQCRRKFERMTWPKNILSSKISYRWSESETELFRTLVGRWKRNFEAISREMRTRSVDQCRRKYKRMTWPKHIRSSKVGRWSKRETEIFRTLVDKWNCDFDAVSRELGTRSADQCRQKYERMIEREQMVKTEHGRPIRRCNRAGQPHDGCQAGISSKKRKSKSTSIVSSDREHKHRTHGYETNQRLRCKARRISKKKRKSNSSAVVSPDRGGAGVIATSSDVLSVF